MPRFAVLSIVVLITDRSRVWSRRLPIKSVWKARRIAALIVAALLTPAILLVGEPVSALTNGRIPAGGVLRITVPEAVGGKTVIGQLTVDRAVGPGYVTAYGCDDGIPTDTNGGVSRSDLNFDGNVSPITSNRLIVQADNNGDVCFYTLSATAMIVDINAVTFDTGVNSFPNRRTDTRTHSDALVAGGGVVRVSVPEAVGGKTVVGQLTIDRATAAGFVTAYGCADGIPTDTDGTISRSDLNYDGAISAVSSNRLIVKADTNGDICFYTLRPTALIVDINGVSDAGISSFPNHRTDTRTQVLPPGSITSVNVPVWPPYTTLPPLDGIASLTGLPANATVTSRPILAVKIDNYGPARPQWALEQADAILEENVEGITRFVALFHTNLPDVVGPVRSARIGDLDLLSAMNRPVFAYSGANPGVTDWISSAARSDVLVDYTALHNPCYFRTADRPGPHNLLLDPTCAVDNSPTAGPARPLWHIDSSWVAPVNSAVVADTPFTVPMDGVVVDWTWDSATGTYLRSQDGQPHLTESGVQISALNVVEVTTTYVPSPVDARSPTPITVGTGTAVVHRNGKAISATWSRATPYDQFEFADTATGQPVPLNTGTTFIELTRA